jgi:hypothetical protein
MFSIFDQKPPEECSGGMTPFALLLRHLVVSCAAQLLQLVWPQVCRDFGTAVTEGLVGAKVCRDFGTAVTEGLVGAKVFKHFDTLDIRD